MRIIGLLICCFLFLVSCDYLKQDPDKIPIARVNNSYLYEDDISSLISENISKEDSVLIVSNYINRWATQQLLIHQSKINLSEDQVEKYEKLVEEYRNDLFTEAYKNAIVVQQIDSTVTTSQLEAYYEQHKDNFKLNEELYKLRFIHVDENYSNLAQTRDRLGRFNEKDREILDSLSIRFKSFNFNDSIWAKKRMVMQALPVLLTSGDNVLKKSNFTQIQDSLGVYLVKIEDVLKPNDIAPLSHVRPIIKEIILNKRKLELIKKLETDITKDAVKNNKYEVYNNQ